MDTIADLEIEFVRQVAAYHTPGPVVRESILLVLRYVKVAINVEYLGRIDSETGEEVLGIAGVLVGSSKPLRDHHVLNARHACNLVAVGFGDCLRERNPVPCH